MSNVIQVFEHTTLPVEGRFTPDHFKCLVQYNERHGNRFFAVGLNRIHFRNYVGVIQVGSLTIEILPKADKAPDSPTQKQKWQGALIEMLRQSGFIRVESMSDARLRLRSSSLLDIYFESFLAEVDDLLHRDLVRKYRQTCGNLSTLKGRIVFQQHLARNIVHREQFFTAHVFYDRNNPFNQILCVALDVLVRVSSNPHLVALARSLAILIQDVDKVEVTERTFSRLSYTRNTERYRRALQLARLIILNYSPDIRGGGKDVLAILFDMNSLFERFVYAQLKRAEAKQAEHRIAFKAQVSRPFWSADNMQKSIRPDIIAKIRNGPDQEKVVIDTKWKIPGDGKPGDADLQQIHTYNVQFGARRGFLLYPRVSANTDVRGRFVQGDALPPSFDHNCSMVFLELFEGNKLRRELGKDIVAMLAGAD
jgi:5-methylcytosine-specific restriction enzyme subunit McrC